MYINQTIKAKPPNVAMSWHVCPVGQYFSLKSPNDLGKFLKVSETEFLIASDVIIFLLV